MRARRSHGAVLALSLLAALGGNAVISPRVAAAEETPEQLRQGLLQAADLIGGLTPEAEGEAAAFRKTLTEAEPDVLVQIQQELSRRPAWKGTGHLLQTLAPVVSLRRAAAVTAADVTAVDCSDPKLECPDTSAQCADGQKLDVSAHIALFITEKTLEVAAIGLDAACGAVGAAVEDFAAPICTAAGAVKLAIRLLTIPAEISDICGGGELEADVLAAVISQQETTINEVNALAGKLGAIDAIDSLRVESALASCTKVSTLLLPETSLTRTGTCPTASCKLGKCANDPVKGLTCASNSDCCFSQTNVEGTFLKTLELVQGLYAGAKRAGVLSAVSATTAAKELVSARSNFDKRIYGEAFKDLCDAYTPLK